MSRLGMAPSRMSVGWMQMLLFTILLLPLIAAGKPNLARIMGPIMGKRGETDVYENDIINRYRNQAEDILGTTALDDDGLSCPLDTLFLTLEPQWQDLILEILRLASYEDGWRTK